LLGPSASGEVQRFAPVSLQFTPLYVGCPVRHEVELEYRFGVRVHRDIGGALVEPVAFGGDGPLEVRGAVGDYAFDGLASARELAFMAGTSSTAYAGVIQHIPELERNNARRVPLARCWPHHTDKGLESETWEIGDGGLTENYGLLPLLQRGVETVIVLINTETPLDLEYVPGQGSYKKHIDHYLPPYFGVYEETPGLALMHNQVFPTADFAELVTALQVAKRAGEPVVVVREHELLANDWWRIRGGRKVRVAWVYLDRVARFEAQLPADTARAIKMGNLKPQLGPCQGFPNYATIDQNFLGLVQLTPYQVRLSTQLMSWIVLDQREVFEGLF
jgi:hypothetical protein